MGHSNDKGTHAKLGARAGEINGSEEKTLVLQAGRGASDSQHKWARPPQAREVEIGSLEQTS